MARYLIGSINLINVILAGILVFLVSYLPLPFSGKGPHYSLPAIKKNEQIDYSSDNKADGSKIPSPIDYVIVAEQNLFHPERKIPVEKEATETLPKPDFILYGTFVSDDLKIAYMKDIKNPYSTPGRGERQVALHLGDSLSGYKVNDIYKEKVVMLKGDDRIEISVLDRAKLKTRATATVLPKSSEKATSGQKQTEVRISGTDKSGKKEDRPLREKKIRTR